VSSELEDCFGVAQVVLCDVNDQMVEQVGTSIKSGLCLRLGWGEEVALSVSVSAARTTKCPRCWRFLVQDPSEEVCGRCQSHINI
jgi:hypothetical protein